MPLKNSVMIRLPQSIRLISGWLANRGVAQDECTPHERHISSKYRAIIRWDESYCQTRTPYHANTRESPYQSVEYRLMLICAR